MPKGYHHLTRDQRCQIYTLKKRGDSARTIATEIGKDLSTVYRELRRNKGGRGYRYKQAHEKAVCRRRAASAREKKMTSELVSIIESKLALQWSPEQISGWLKKKDPSQAVSHERIYQHIWLDKRRGGSLYKHLRHNGKKYNKRSKGSAGRGCIPHRVDISERPDIVKEKSRVGDWELDTIIGSGQSGAIVSMVDRFSKLTKLVRISGKTAIETEHAILERLSSIKDFVHTLTSDNGKEFANHLNVKKCLEAEFYFATPYHSWERGLNEHTNGLVRQYFPKGQRFDGISDDRLMEVEILLNNRPRKVLDFATPIEVFSRHTQATESVALQN